jgi:hypothetical protein
MAIIRYLEAGSFDPEVTRAMGAAYDAACRQLHYTGRHLVMREVVANQIIEAAKGGERDPVRLCEIALAFSAFSRGAVAGRISWRPIWWSCS